jgi:hypothetical protein
MICSVLIPSRKHVAGLERAIRSVAHLKDVEVLVRLDDDDAASVELCGKLKLTHNIRVITGSRFDGYAAVPRFLNELISIATGKWITMLDDDASYDMIAGSVPWEQQLAAIPTTGHYVQADYYYLGPSIYVPPNRHGPVGWFAPINSWDGEIGNPVDVWFEGDMWRKKNWTPTPLKGLIYNHQREEGRNRE